MPVDEPFNVYREQLTSLYLGLALWDPVPDSTINHRVSIGDVGFVREGAFSRMFNVILKHDHPSNQKIGKPDHYVPLHLDPFVNSRKSTLNKGDYRSRRVSTEEYNPVTATPNDDLTYECPGIGAVLYLPAKGDREDVLRTKVFEDYIRDNVASWFAWSQKNGLGVERTEDLILVTGCTLAKSWAIAAFCDPTTESKVSLSVQSQSDGRESFTWRNVHGSVMNGNSLHDPTNPQPAPNQCVFIKGFRAKRVLFWTTTLRAAAGPLPDDPDNRDEDEIQVTSVPYAPKYRDPLVAVLDYIAEQCPEDTIAIAHDDDLDFIKDVEVLTADAVEKFLRDNQIPVLTENGAAIIRDPEEGPPVLRKDKAIFVASSASSSTSSLAPSPLPSTPPPFPDAAFSPSQSPLMPPYPSPPQSQVYIPSPIRQAHALPYGPPASLTPNVYINPALAAPTLMYDVRYHPSHANPNLPPAVLASPASYPPLLSLAIRIPDIPWKFNVFPDARFSPGGAVVTVQDVLLAIYFHLRTAVKSDEYDAMSRARKAEIFQSFERRVGADPAQRGKGLRRIDFLGGRFHAQGLVRAQSNSSVCDVVVQ